MIEKGLLTVRGQPFSIVITSPAMIKSIYAYYLETLLIFLDFPAVPILPGQSQ